MINLKIREEVTVGNKFSTQIEKLVETKMMKVRKRIIKEAWSVCRLTYDGFGPLGLGVEPSPPHCK